MSEDVLATLLAEREIWRQLALYCRAVDRFDVELWKSVWHPDGTLDYRGSNLRGLAAPLAEMMTRGHDAWASHSHQITSAHITVQGDRAVSETFNTAILRGYPDASGAVVDNHYRGRYLDRWSRRDGRWAIDHRHLPGGASWQQTATKSHNGEHVRRGPDDPSYELFASLGGVSSHDLRGDPVGVLTAEREIRQQLNNYSRGVDRFDVDLWQSVWHEDGTLEYPDPGLSGRAADRDLAELMVRGHAVWAAHTHQLTNSLIVVDGDRAVSETGATAILHGRRDESGGVTDDHYRGRYLDRWSRRDGRWAIDHRLMVEEFMWTQDGAASRTIPAARRDRDDPVYELFASVG